MIGTKKKTLLLITIIVLLLVSDLVFLYLVVQKKPAAASPAPQSFTTYMTDLLRTKVGFTEEQISLYIQRRTEHKKNMCPLYDQIKETKEDFYQLLQTDVNDSAFHHYLGMVGEQQKEFDRKIFYHLFSLRELCTEDQLPLLTAAMQDLLKYKHLE